MEMGPSLQAAALPLEPTPNPQNCLRVHLDGAVGNELILLPWLLKFQWLHSRPKYLEVQMALFMEGLQVASSLRLFLLKLPTPLPHPQGNGDNIVYTNPGLAVPRKLTSSIQVAQSW